MENRSLIGFKMAFSSVDGGGVVERETLRQTNEYSMFWWFFERGRGEGKLFFGGVLLRSFPVDSIDCVEGIRYRWCFKVTLKNRNTFLGRGFCDLQWWKDI